MNSEEWQKRMAEADVVIEQCSAAFDLIPLWALERNQNWMPSVEAIVIMKRAKDSLRDFIAVHYHGKAS